MLEPLDDEEELLELPLPPAPVSTELPHPYASGRVRVASARAFRIDAVEARR